ncbi:MAG: Dna2/Cas4 domain-containing protein, partial [Ktedonobacteraceae bacterium]|nr:Dna2/Cas4 domain-containing protein [Ktedonobacteraceae bacterium]
MFSETEIELNMLPIAALNTLEFCPRYFYYECVAHRTSRHAEDLSERRGDDAVVQAEETQLRRLWVWSSHFRVSGYATVMEESEQGFVPVEYRNGKMAEWLDAPIQLCAQALCLEEMTNCSLQYGYVYHEDGRQREKVDFSEMVRQQTEASIYYA